jgi:hypothetical protein
MWVYFLQFKFDLNGNAGFGVNVESKGISDIKTKHIFKTKMKYEWNCTPLGCQENKLNKFSFKFIPSIELESKSKVTVTPYMDLNTSVEIKLYSSLPVVKVQTGVIAQLPLTMYKYTSNMCSDVNFDGKNEKVKLSIFDANAQLFSYLKYELLDTTYINNIDLGLDGWKTNKKSLRELNDVFEIDYSLELFMEKMSLYSKNIYSRGLESQIIEPVFDIFDSNDSNSIFHYLADNSRGIFIEPRSCYPFSDEITYRIDWGDGSEIYEGKGGFILHDWIGKKPYTVKVQMLNDAIGRTFEGDGVTKTFH